MTATNAAIWFASDAFDPAAKGINGRRVAGQSFLRGFFAHAQVDEFVALAHSSSDHSNFARIARDAGVTRPLRHVRLDRPADLAPVEIVSYPAPLSAVECWRRAPYGAAAWALCGITHTTATRNVMQAIFDLRSAPQMPWDALICTSLSVQASIRRLMELAEVHFEQRFSGGVLPARPLLPVIPLGITCDDFKPDPALGRDLRERIGAGRDDMVAVAIARLTPDEKFDPLPMFMAMEAASAEIAQLEKKATSPKRLHLVFCGQFSDPAWEKVYAEAAARIMPSCGYHRLDGGNPDDRKATLSGGDVFVFPIDNLQETFGLAPVEAMAAGLPVIVSDWDGMKDTVTPEVGVRVPTELPRPGLSTYVSQRHLGGTDTYVQYLSQISAMTPVDPEVLTRALVTLARDRELRKRMGAAGQARARALYDWSVVIPQMQALWGEQSAMLAHARRKGGAMVAKVQPGAIPVGPTVEEMFAAYPTGFAAIDRRLAARSSGGVPTVREMFALRNYALRRRLIDDPARIETVQAAYEAKGQHGATEAEIAAATRFDPDSVARASLWLLKYGYLTEVP